jgi:signal transduction histidine kinase
MFQINSLRFRVAFFYALFGAVLSIFLSAGVFLIVQQMGHRLMDETLRAELDDSVERHARDSVFVPPNTVSIKGYVLSGGEPEKNFPDEIRKLLPGRYNVSIKEIDYRVLVADRDGARYFMLFDTESQHHREKRFSRFLAIFALLITLCSAAGGFWLANRVTAPVTRLAEQVVLSEPGDTNLSLTKLARNDEVGELARAFDRYLRRLREFIERESYFTADVSHELRTPLAIILGAVEVLEQDETLTPKQKERIARIRRAAQDMIDLTAALLLMARERLAIVDEPPCHVAEVMRACVEKHQHLIGDRPIHMEVEFKAEPDLIVERPLLEIVIGNLIRNALFNTKSGTVLLRLEAEKLVVQDTGIGMRPEELARALERHFKGASSAGAGVGLSLVKRICDRYGWRISLESQEGQGTRVEVIFPAMKKE